MEDGSIEARNEFEVLKKRVYLNWASISPAPASAAAAVAEMAGDASSSFGSDALHDKWTLLSSGFRNEAAKLLNTQVEHIATCGSSTTRGLQIAMDSINPGKGDNIVTTDLEFPELGAELRKWRERGVEVRTVKSTGGRFSPEDVGAVLDGRTRAVLFSSVCWVNGFRADAAQISAVARERGAYVVIDAVQHLGAMPFDASAIKPDFAAAGGQKWLTSPFGSGILYVSGRAAEELEPPHYSLTASDAPGEGWARYFTREDRYPLDLLEPVKGAARMEDGGWRNHAGLVCLRESLSLLNRTGAAGVAARIRRLSKLLVGELEGMGAEVISPQEEEHASSITTFRTGGAEEHWDAVQRLAGLGIDVSCRGGSGMGGIRVAVHHMNNEDDIDRLVGALRGR